jgi:hypothetical protein
MSDYGYFKERRSEVYYNGRTKYHMAGWIVTAPKDLPAEQHEIFFKSSYNFLCDRYGGEQNCVQAIVHQDESGQPHLHFCFIPVVPETNIKHNEQGLTEKISADKTLTKEDLRSFHPDLQSHLSKEGIDARGVYTGVTREQGGNRTVKQMKKERDLQYEKEREVEHEQERVW